MALQFGTTQTNAVSLRGLTGSPPRGITLNPGTGADGSIPANNGRTTVFVQAGNHSIDGTVALTLGGGSAGSPVHHVWEIQGSQNLVVGAPISATLSSGNTLTKAGTGTLTLSGNNAQPQLWDGGLTVAQGTVLANSPSSSTGAGSVTVNSGATLGGRGVISMGSQGLPTTTINGGGTLTAGTSAGAPKLSINSAGGGGGLTMNAGSTFAVKLFGVGATEISQVAVQGFVVIDTNKIDLDLSSLNSTQVAQLRTDVLATGVPRVYRIMTVTDGLAAGSNQFDAAGFNVTNLGLFSPGEWSFGTFDTTGTGIDGDPAANGFVTLVFTPVPEPGWLLASAVSCLGVYRGLRPRLKDKASVTGPA
ncbi:MAG: autotransporter-associated beta strand repeat-containing protein [Gemmataceae bacterium]